MVLYLYLINFRLGNTFASVSETEEKMDNLNTTTASIVLRNETTPLDLVGIGLNIDTKN